MSVDKIVLWEAHRGGGGGYEMPESCMLSFEYAWMLGGIPEADANMTADGVMVSIHDPNMKRTSNAPEEIASRPVSTLTFDEIRKWDIGGDEYPGQKVPAVYELLERLQEDPDKQIIIDYKSVELDLLAGMIREYGVESQVTFAYCDPDLCVEMKKRLSDIQIKLWVGGNADEIKGSFIAMRDKGFMGFEQIQLHLVDLQEPTAEWRYQLDRGFLGDALAECKKSDVILQVLPWQFDKEDIFRLMDIGIRSYAVDYPNKFCRTVAEWFAFNRKVVRP